MKDNKIVRVHYGVPKNIFQKLIYNNKNCICVPADFFRGFDSREEIFQKFIAGNIHILKLRIHNCGKYIDRKVKDITFNNRNYEISLVVPTQISINFIQAMMLESDKLEFYDKMAEVIEDVKNNNLLQSTKK